MDPCAHIPHFLAQGRQILPHVHVQVSRAWSSSALSRITGREFALIFCSFLFSPFTTASPDLTSSKLRHMNQIRPCYRASIQAFLQAFIQAFSTAFTSFTSSSLPPPSLSSDRASFQLEKEKEEIRYNSNLSIAVNNAGAPYRHPFDFILRALGSWFSSALFMASAIRSIPSDHRQRQQQPALTMSFSTVLSFQSVTKVIQHCR